jgi:hypothetical protein
MQRWCTDAPPAAQEAEEVRLWRQSLYPRHRRQQREEAEEAMERYLSNCSLLAELFTPHPDGPAGLFQGAGGMGAGWLAPTARCPAPLHAFQALAAAVARRQGAHRRGLHVHHRHLRCVATVT